MSTEWLMALTALVSGLITGVPALLAAILLAVRSHGQAKRDAVITEMERLISWQGKQLEEQQEVITHLVDSQSDCREELIREHERGNSLAAILRRMGQDPGPDPPLPKRPPRQDPEFMKNTTAHNTGLLREAEKPDPEKKL